MNDDIRPVTRTKPKVIEPVNDLNAVHPAIQSFADDPGTAPAAQSTALPTVAEASVEPDESVSLPAPVEKVSAAEEVVEEKDEPEEPKGDRPKRKFPIGWPPSKKDWLIIGTSLVLLVALGGALYSLTHRDAPVVRTAVKKKVVKPAPTVITSDLTGLPVADASVNDRPVTGVMIENSLDARPQSALDQAGIVFEAVAEGGVTRFFTVFQDSQPDYIGPVRSARPYYVQWCLSFDCAYAHVGGSPDGLAGIKQWGVKDLDQFANSGAYHRISSRYAPHNVYTSIGELNALEASKGYGKPKYTGFSRKTEQPYKAPDPAATGAAAKKQDTRAPATSIDFAMSGYYYDPHFDYDAATNTYKRSEAGQPHMAQHSDGSQVQIAPKVVVGMIVGLTAGALDAQGSAYSNYQTVGSGDALVFQDGTVTKIHWAKPDVGSALSFTDDAGKPFKLDAGQTWITAVTDASKAAYK
jgi:hypothetical protein